MTELVVEADRSRAPVLARSVALSESYFFFFAWRDLLVRYKQTGRGRELVS
jgi:hypothetical protein